MSNVVRVAVTGAAGQVAYTHAAATGLGRGLRPEYQGHPAAARDPRSISPKPMDALEGVAMELDDCAFPTLQDDRRHRRPEQGLRRLQLCAAGRRFPRKQGMERKDLLGMNGKIFVRQGQGAGGERGQGRAHPGRRQPVQHQLPDRLPQRPRHPRRRWTAMTRLDHNRAVAALAKKAGVANEAVTCVTIWGNHSNTQFPDFTNAKINGKPATEVITDRAWLETVMSRSARNAARRSSTNAACRAPSPRPTARSITSRAC